MTAYSAACNDHSADQIAVTHAQVNFPEYFAPIQEYAPQSCIAAIRSSVKVIDTILDAPGPAAGLLKGLFGLQELEDDDFAEVLQSPLGESAVINHSEAIVTNEDIGKRRTGTRKVQSALSGGAYDD